MARTAAQAAALKKAQAVSAAKRAAKKAVKPDTGIRVKRMLSAMS